MYTDMGLLLLTDNADPYFSLTNFGRKARILHGKIRLSDTNDRCWKCTWDSRVESNWVFNSDAAAFRQLLVRRSLVSQCLVRAPL